MGPNSFWSRLDTVLDFPQELLEYRRFIEDSPKRSSQEPYVLYRHLPRFEPAADDQLALAGGLEILADREETRLVHRPTETTMAVAGVPAHVTGRVLSLIDGSRVLAQVEAESGASPEQLDRIMKATFGRVVLAPRTVERYQAALSGHAIVRFPAVAYEIERSYWDNMIAVRDRVCDETRALSTVETFWPTLRKLHVLALLGAEGDSFYRPLSPIAERRARPGALYDKPARVLRTATEAFIIEGPRVSVPPVGNDTYFRLLSESLDDRAALAPEREVTDASGLHWGTVLTARARGDRAALPWFFPPRPIRPEHLHAVASLWQKAYASAQSRGESECLDALAGLHWTFVRLHPFSCANQSLVMNLVNYLLDELGGAAIPHLLLDQLALRLSASAYARLFVRAVQSWRSGGLAPLERQTLLLTRRQQLETLVQRLVASTERFEDFGAGQGARLALLLD